MQRIPYEQILREAIILPNWMDAANSFKKHFEKNLETYKEIWANTNVPSNVVAAINMMESGGRFDSHIHCGDPLVARTIHVPKGRPIKGNPPFTFLESCIDCFVDLKKLNLHPWGEDFVADLEKLEAYNGLGYKKKNEPSPYILSGTQFYTKGKYVADGVYDPNAVSKQLGILPMLIVTRYFKS